MFPNFSCEYTGLSCDTERSSGGTRSELQSGPHRRETSVYTAFNANGIGAPSDQKTTRKLTEEKSTRTGPKSTETGPKQHLKKGSKITLGGLPPRMQCSSRYSSRSGHRLSCGPAFKSRSGHRLSCGPAFKSRPNRAPNRPETGPA